MQNQMRSHNANHNKASPPPIQAMHPSSSNPQLHQLKNASLNLNLAKHAYQGAHHSLTTKNSISRADVARAKSGGGNLDGPFPEVEKYMQLHHQGVNTANTSQVMINQVQQVPQMGKSTSRAALNNIKPQKVSASKQQKRMSNQTPLSSTGANLVTTPVNQTTNVGHKGLKYINGGAAHQSTSALHATFGQTQKAAYNNISHVAGGDNNNITTNTAKGASSNNPMMKRMAKRATNLQTQAKQQQIAQQQNSQKQLVGIVNTMGSPQQCSLLVEGPRSISGAAQHSGSKSTNNFANTLQYNSQSAAQQPNNTSNSAYQQHAANSSKSATQNLGVRISQILRNSQKSPQNSDRDVVKFYDQLDQLFEQQKQGQNKPQTDYDASILFKDQKILHQQHNQGNKSTKNHSNKISDAVFKAISMSDNLTAKQQSINPKTGKSRTAKKQLQTQHSRSNKSHSTKDQIVSATTTMANGINQTTSKKQNNNKQATELLDEIMSRNGIDDCTGPIDLRIAAASTQQNHQVNRQGELHRGNKKNSNVGATYNGEQSINRHQTAVQKVINNDNEGGPTYQANSGNKGKLSMRHQQSNSSAKLLKQELQYNRQQQSKSQCKGGNVGGNAGPLKKSFSIALLKASNNAQSQLAESHPNEYNNSGQLPSQQLIQRQEQNDLQQKGPFGMYYSRQNSQKEYIAVGPIATHQAKHQHQNHQSQLGPSQQQQKIVGLLQKRSDSSNSVSSLGEISVNSVNKQQMVKNSSHYGALKHLAQNNIASTGSVNDIAQGAASSSTTAIIGGSKATNSSNSTLFTRNGGQGNNLVQAQKKLTSFDENVCVNQIRETGIAHQKFDKLSPQQEVQTRFSARKNYGSVCIQPASNKNKPLFFQVVDSKGNEQTTSQNGESRLSSLEDQQRRYNVFSNKVQGQASQPHHRVALSYQNSPSYTPKHGNTAVVGSSAAPVTSNKSPFISKESRKHLHIKDGSSKGPPKGHMPNTTTAKRSKHASSIDCKKTEGVQLSLGQQQHKSKLWMAEGIATASESKKSHHQSQHEIGSTNGKKSQVKQGIRMKSPGIQNGYQQHQQARTTKQTPFMQRNSNPSLPGSFAVAGNAQNNNQYANNNNDSASKKKHKLSKSRELYGTGVVNQMNLNSSISSKTSQLKQENVFNSKRKSHGIQTRAMNSGSMKRRSSGSNLIVGTEHNQTQPLDLRQLRKIASISPPKVPRVVERQETDYDDENDDGETSPIQENFVEQIVDLLDKRNLINTKNNQGNKPKVNKILSSLLKAHLKAVDASATGSIASSSQKQLMSNAHQQLLSSTVGSQPSITDQNQEQSQQEIVHGGERMRKTVKSQQTQKQSTTSRVQKSLVKQDLPQSSSRVSLGAKGNNNVKTNPQHQQHNEAKYQPRSRSSVKSPHSNASDKIVAVQQQKQQSFKNTPAFKYPSSSKQTANPLPVGVKVGKLQEVGNQENEEEKYTLAISGQDSQSSAAAGAGGANQGEMTSPDELYYVANNNNQNKQLLQNQHSGSSSERSSNAPILNQKTNKRSTNSSQDQSQPNSGRQQNSSIDSPVKQSKILGSSSQPQSSYNFVTANSRSSGSPSDNQQSGKQTPYYTGGISSKRGSQDDEKRVEGKNAYYTNNNSNAVSNPMTGDRLKESTRFSSNERDNVGGGRSYGNNSRGSVTREKQKNSARAAHEYVLANQEEASAKKRKDLNQQQSVSSKSLRGNNSQGKLKQQSCSPQVTDGNSASTQHHSTTAQQNQSPQQPDIQSTKRLASGPTGADKNTQILAREGYVQEQTDDDEEDDQSQDENESLIIAIRRHYMSQKKRNTHFPSTLRCYRVQSIVGKGAFGKVALAIQRLTNKPVAIKMIDKTTLQPGQMEKVRSEVALMSAIRHKHIIRLLEVFESSNHMYMVFEYAAGGDLLQLVKKKRCLTENEARKIFRQVVYGIAHCHCRSVLHRDIKLDNILLDDKNHVKVCDFGISRTIENLNEPVMEQCGTPAYIAPEILYEDGYKGFKSDIWGLGVLLYAMVTGTVPFRAQNMRELKYVISAGQFSFPSSNPRDSHRYSDTIKDLIRSMLIVDTKSRISIPEILAHPWLNPMPDRQSMQQGLNYQQLLSMHALQPFGGGDGENSEQNYVVADKGKDVVNQIRVENLFIGHGSDGDSGDSSLNARIDALTLTQTQLNEITIDHATVYINEKAITKLENFGFPKKLARAQIQNNVLNHATASYNLLVL